MASDRHVAPAPGLRLRRWGDETCAVVFAPDVAKTHLVSADAWRLLQACGDASAGLDALAAGFDTALIDGLVEAGLLRRLP